MDNLTSLTPQQYLQRFHINFYLQDLLNLLVAKKKSGADAPRGAVEFIGKYFDTVLRGGHVINRRFEYIDATPLNRRAFVSLLRSSLSGVGDPECIALTLYDFHDLVLRLCADFPLSVVEEAAEFTDMADSRRHHLLGEMTTLGAETFDAGRLSSQVAPDGDIGVGVKRSKLLVMRSLQRFVEVHLVYPEVIAMLKNLFRAGRPDIEGVVSWRTHMITCSMIVAEVQKLQSASSVEVALPSRKALATLLLIGAGEYPAGKKKNILPSSSASTVTYSEVIHAMAEHFELVPDPYPEEVVGDFGDSMPEVVSPDDNDLPVFAVDEQSRLKGVASSVDKRKRDKKSKGQC